MSNYISLTGTVTQIQPFADNSTNYGCTLIFTVRGTAQGEVQFTLNGNTYVPDNIPFNSGDRVTFFYDGNAPVPLIYPPRYTAVVAAPADQFQYYLGEFYNSFISTDGQIQINKSNSPLPMYLPNGQVYSGALSGKTVLVEYTTSTRSIPAIIQPRRITVFCYQ